MEAGSFQLESIWMSSSALECCTVTSPARLYSHTVYGFNTKVQPRIYEMRGSSFM